VAENKCVKFRECGLGMGYKEIGVAGKIHAWELLLELCLNRTVL
jgi:hypothetical protein